jgi:hypothetical protein
MRVIRQALTISAATLIFAAMCTVSLWTTLWTTGR